MTLGSLAGLPVRVAVGAARTGAGLVEDIAARLGLVHGRSREYDEFPAEPEAPATAPVPPDAPGASVRRPVGSASVDGAGAVDMPVVDVDPVPDAPPAPEPEPDHVSEEPVLVAEIAEPGAEDGAGPELHVRPPWDGYPGEPAPAVIEKVAEATPEVAAAIVLYESLHRKRRTVIAAAESRVAQAGQPSS